MLVPGAQGQKSTFPDGIQVDHLSENTVGHGARPQAITNPTSYPVNTGDISEKLEASASATLTQSMATIVSLPITAGRWLIVYNGQVTAATAGDDCYMSMNGTSATLAKDHARLPTAASNTYSAEAVLTEVRSSAGETVTLRALNATAARGTFSGYIIATRIA